MLKNMYIYLLVTSFCCVCANSQSIDDFCPERIKLLASDGASYDYFCRSVAVDGDTVVVGADGDDDNGSSSGSAYVYRFDGSSWIETKLLASDGAIYDNFGISVAVSGDTVVVGAAYDDDNGNSSGSVYVFSFDGSSWIETKLTASDGASGDNFGISVAVSGDTVVVGQYDDYGSSSGSAYIYRFDGSAWIETKLLASDEASEDWFGNSVAVSGDTVVVGAAYDDDNGSSSGSAYIYRFDGSSWIETKLLASDGASDDRFGWSVAVDGDTVVVGAAGNDDNGTDSGSAYIYRFDGTAWNETIITASDGASADYFGLSVAVDGDTVVVGAYGDDDNGNSSGSVYVFSFDGSSWIETKLTASDGESNDWFGLIIAVDGDTVVVGAYADDDYSGSAYIYDIGSVINLETNELTSDLSRAISDALPNDRLAVRNLAFAIDGVVTSANKPLHFISVESISIPDTMTWMPGNNTIVSASAQATGTDWVIGGLMLAPGDGAIVFDGVTPSIADTGNVLLNGSTLIPGSGLENTAGLLWLDGQIAGDASTAINGVNRGVADTVVFGNYTNAGTTIINAGTLSIVGNLDNSGTLLGAVDTGPGVRGGGDEPVAGDGMAIGGDYTIGINASLQMIDFGWTLGVGGNLDCAINDNARFNMREATISMTGLGSNSQTFELMSADLGAVMDGLDAALAGNYPVRTLKVKSGTTVTLVDLHDNANDGAGSCEALYVENLIVQTGGTLVTGGCNVYAVNSVIDGVVKGVVTPIGDIPDCPSDISGNDGVVSIEDLLTLIAAFGTSDPNADINNDNIVDITDLLLLIAAFGDCPQ